MTTAAAARALLLVLCALVLAAPAPGAGAPPPVGALAPAPADADARALARRAEDTLRSRRTYMRGAMTVESPRLTTPRVVEFESWDDRPGKRSFIRIHAPAKDAGTGFLKLHPNLWMYVPRVERTLRIPPSMMLQPWMGSDFTNDDLVNDSSEIDDYDHRLLGVDADPEGPDAASAFVVEYVPHEDVPVVWGKIIGWIDGATGAPLRQDFYDEDGERLRALLYSDLREVQGRHVPHRWVMFPLERAGHETRIQIEAIEFDADIDDSVFTTRNLKKR